MQSALRAAALGSVIAFLPAEVGAAPPSPGQGRGPETLPSGAADGRRTRSADDRPHRESFLSPGEKLVIEGVPEIPMELVRRADRYTESRSAVFQAWHPTKRELLITTRFAETAQVHIVGFPMGARRQMTFLPDRVAAASFPARGSGDFFVFSRDTGGDEWFQTYRCDIQTGEITLLTDGKSRNSLGVWSTGGDRLAYTSTRRTGKDVDIYLVDPRDPKSDRLLAALDGPGWAPADWSSDDRLLAVIEMISANESYVWVFDTVTGAKRLITPKGGPLPIFYRKVEFEDSPRSPRSRAASPKQALIVLTDRGSEFLHVERLDIETGTHERVGPNPTADIEDFELSPDGRMLGASTNEGGASRVWFLDVASRRVVPGPTMPIGVLAGMSWHPHHPGELGFGWVSSKAPGDVYSYDLPKKRLHRWTESETGGIDTSKFREPELVRWRSFDGLEISGFLYRPPERFEGKRPVVVNIHGGPEAQSRPWFLGRSNYLLEELGVAILFPNVRGSTGYGKTFLRADNGKKRQDAYRDIEALLDWISTEPTLDHERVMVTGGSYGGHMTLAVATTYPERIRAALSVVGMSNLVTFLERTESYRRDLRRVEYGDERDAEMRAYLESIAPLRHVDRIVRPLFVVQGKNDPRVPVSESDQIVAALKKRNIPVWYLLAEDEGHGFAKKANADFQFYATLLFIEHHLLR